MKKKMKCTQNPFLQKGGKWTQNTQKRVISLSFFILSLTNMTFNKNFLKITYKKNLIISQAVAPRWLTNTWRASFILQ